VGASSARRRLWLRAAINGVPVGSMDSLTVYLESKPQVGDTVELSVIRDGQPLTIQVELTARTQMIG
jgi:S1-C subfamily serine protease